MKKLFKIAKDVDHGYEVLEKEPMTCFLSATNANFTLIRDMMMA